MRHHLKAYDLWEVVETAEPPTLEENPTIAHIRFHNEQVAKRAKAFSILHSTVDDDIFMRISNLDTTKEIWEKLQVEFFGNERTKKMKVLNHKREFEALKMNEAETESGCLLKKLRTNNGEEYTSVEFNSSCDGLGVELQLIVNYSPQQNGVAEKNILVLEMARCMIF